MTAARLSGVKLTCPFVHNTAVGTTLLYWVRPPIDTWGYSTALIGAGDVNRGGGAIWNKSALFLDSGADWNIFDVGGELDNWIGVAVIWGTDGTIRMKATRGWTSFEYGAQLTYTGGTTAWMYIAAVPGSTRDTTIQRVRLYTSILTEQQALAELGSVDPIIPAWGSWKLDYSTVLAEYLADSGGGGRSLTKVDDTGSNTGTITDTGFAAPTWGSVVVPGTADAVARVVSYPARAYGFVSASVQASANSIRTSPAKVTANVSAYAPGTTVYPKSVEVGRNRGVDYAVSSGGPVGGFLVSGWTRVIYPDAFPYSYGNTDTFYIRGPATTPGYGWQVRCPTGNSSATSVDDTNAFYNANTMLFARSPTRFDYDYINDFSYYFQGGHTAAEVTGWVWVAVWVQVLPDSLVLTQWLKFGADGEVLDPSTSTITLASVRAQLQSDYGWTAEQAASWVPQDPDTLFIGTDPGYATRARVDALSSTPSKEWLNGVAVGSNPASNAWACWKLEWVDGLPSLSDYSGNGRNLQVNSGGVLYEGLQGPIGISTPALTASCYGNAYATPGRLSGRVYSSVSSSAAMVSRSASALAAAFARVDTRAAVYYPADQAHAAVAASVGSSGASTYPSARVAGVAGASVSSRAASVLPAALARGVATASVSSVAKVLTAPALAHGNVGAFVDARGRVTTPARGGVRPEVSATVRASVDAYAHVSSGYPLVRGFAGEQVRTSFSASIVLRSATFSGYVSVVRLEDVTVLPLEGPTLVGAILAQPPGLPWFRMKG